MHKEKILMTVWKFQNLQGFVLWKAIQEWLNVKSCFPIQILCNCHFCGIWLKIRLSNFKMLFQFFLTKLLKNELLCVYRKLIRWLSIEPRSLNYNSSTLTACPCCPFFKINIDLTLDDCCLNMWCLVSLLLTLLNSIQLHSNFSLEAQSMMMCNIQEYGVRSYME